MRIVFCTTCKGRASHVKQTLPQNLADNPTAAFVLLDYESPDDLQSYLWTEHAQDIAAGRLIVYRHENGGAPFHMAHAKNMAARCGMLEGADVLVTLDADNFTGAGFSDFLATSFRRPRPRPGLYLCPNFPLLHSLRRHGKARPARGHAGRLALAPQTFIKLGGYDEFYDTWRGEDTDMIFRLERMGYVARHIDNRHLNAIPHGAGVRFAEYPHAKQYDNEAELAVIQSRTDTLVNYGQIGVGTVYRNSSQEAIELAPLPTRVFGIGLHRTGTTSLHKALGLLGLDSFHWGAGEAPRIWQEMQTLGRSQTLEQWYALSDLPIPLLYESLDKAYPGSKFILTEREEGEWLRSVERLWDPRYNPDRWIWDKYPFSHHIHTVLYGQREFNAPKMLARYREHNAKVRWYFKYRPDDLLVLPNGQWPALCRFLGRPVPSAPYPRANVSAVRP